MQATICSKWRAKSTIFSWKTSWTQWGYYKDMPAYKKTSWQFSNKIHRIQLALENLKKGEKSFQSGNFKILAENQ